MVFVFTIFTKLPFAKITGLSTFCLIAILLAACSPPQMTPSRFEKFTNGLQPVSHVDIKKVMGDWHVYANIPYWAEANAYGSIERYTLMPDGRIDTQFIFRKDSPDGKVKKIRSVATVLDHESNALWQVQIFGVLKLPYVIIGVDPDYDWFVIGYPDRKLGWVLSREPTLPDSDYQSILKLLEDQGYDPGKFKRVPRAEIPAGDL